mgnify:CR=1 FL=1
MSTVSFIFIFLINFSFSQATEVVQFNQAVDVRLVNTNCDARWEFSKYMSCLDRNGHIPGIRASYLSRRSINRFYTVSINEGEAHCESLNLDQSFIKACVNRFVAHKAQMIGSARGANSFNVESVRVSGSAASIR